MSNTLHEHLNQSKSQKKSVSIFSKLRKHKYYGTLKVISVLIVRLLWALAENETTKGIVKYNWL